MCVVAGDKSIKAPAAMDKKASMTLAFLRFLPLVFIIVASGFIDALTIQIQTVVR